MDNREKTGKHLKRLAWFLDNSIPLPRTNYKIGVDALIGLIPGIGDGIGAVMSSYILGTAAQMGVPKKILLRMGYNIAVDSVIGLIPFVGDAFDMVWKSNLRNVQLLEAYMDNPREATISSRYFMLALIAVLAFVFILISSVGFLILRWMWQMLSS
ncbi:MAG: DUF4112 domain-containing protein [Desulfuromonadaceae bacterium]|nr:DUF4112 domain-containing protein [Desulfuromonadaceae bacterium]